MEAWRRLPKRASPTATGGCCATGNYINGPCTGTAGAWYGVTCTNGRVTTLDLAGAQLEGSIPSSLGLLTGLTVLALQGNSLSGRLPSSLGLLTALDGLSLNGNLFTGPIPSSFCGLKTSISLQVSSGTTCYPSCLASFSNFTRNKDASLSACPFPVQFLAQSYSLNADCSSPDYLFLEMYGGCEENMLAGYVPSNTSSRRVVTNSTYSKLTYSNVACMGVPVIASTQTFLSYWDGLSGGGLSHYASDTPGSYIRNTFGAAPVITQPAFMRLSYSTAQACAQGTIAGLTTAYIARNYARCEVATNGDTDPGAIVQDRGGWVETTYTKYTCDGAAAGYVEFADSACSSTTPLVATFTGTTGGSPSTTLQMSGLSYNDGEFAMRGSTGVIRQGMEITWAGSSGPAVTIDNCRYTYPGATGSCTLSSAQTIPEGTLVTGTYTPAPVAFPAGCEDNRQLDSATDNWNAYRRYTCGTLPPQPSSTYLGPSADPPSQGSKQVLATVGATFSAAIMAAGLVSLVATALSPDRDSGSAPAPPAKSFP